MTSYDMRLTHQFSMFVAGCCGTGKTTFVNNIIRNHQIMITPSIQKIIYFYSTWQDIFESLQNEVKNITFDNTTPTIESIDKYTENRTIHCLIILDDLMTEIKPEFAKIFTTFRHLEISTIFLTQNIFYNNDTYRNMSRNATYICVMKNPRDSSFINKLGYSIDSSRVKDIVKIYQQSTQKPFSYLFIDFSMKCPEALRFRTNILPHEAPMRVFIDKDKL